MFKNVAQVLTVFCFDSTGAPKTGDSANLTAYVRKGTGTVTALTDTSATEPDSTNAKGIYEFDLGQSETNDDKLTFSCKSSTSGVTCVCVPTVAYTRVDVAKVAGTDQTARDLGASVLLSSGTGTGQLDFTSGVVKSNLVQILATALTETAGLLAAGFKKFFNVATPTGTLNSLPPVAPGLSGGMLITGGTNAGDTTFSGTINFTNGIIVTQSDTNQPGLSVTGNGSGAGAIFTGGMGGACSFGSGAGDGILAVGSSGDGIKATQGSGGVPIRGSITGNLSGSAGSVTGAVGSVAGNVGGNVAGSVGSVSAGVTLADTQGSYAPAKAGDAMTLTSDYDAAKAAATQASVDAIPTTPLLAANYTAPPTVAEISTQLERSGGTLSNLSGVIVTKLDTMLVLDTDVYQFTANALELGPAGSGAGSAPDILVEFTNTAVRT
jgi:hypothetical protein